MAGFQVANFSCGKNIKDDERQRAIAAMNNATTRRGQDIQAAQADANRAENARQFDERQAAAAAAQDSGQRVLTTEKAAGPETRITASAPPVAVAGAQMVSPLVNGEW